MITILKVILLIKIISPIIKDYTSHNKNSKQYHTHNYYFKEFHTHNYYFKDYTTNI